MVDREDLPSHSKIGNFSWRNSATVPNRSKRMARYFFTYTNLLIERLFLSWIQWAPSGKPFLSTVIVGNFFFPVLPTKFDDFTVDSRGEINES